MKKSLYRMAIALLCAVATVPLFAQSPKVVPLQKKTDVKAVYQVSQPTEHEGFDKGLFYARKVLGGYSKQGVPNNEVDLHLVYHSAAIPALLNDATYQRLTDKKVPNPNKALVDELVQMGVHLEICGDTMQQKDVKETDLLPGVDIVPGAFPRLIDLQLAGYPYIKFE